MSNYNSYYNPHSFRTFRRYRRIYLIGRFSCTILCRVQIGFNFNRSICGSLRARAETEPKFLSAKAFTAFSVDWTQTDYAHHAVSEMISIRVCRSNRIRSGHFLLIFFIVQILFFWGERKNCVMAKPIDNGWTKKKTLSIVPHKFPRKCKNGLVSLRQVIVSRVSMREHGYCALEKIIVFFLPQLGFVGSVFVIVWTEL